MAITPYPMMSGLLMGLLALLVIWELIWKGIALWKAGRNKQLEWFIALLIFNTAGILPIIYITFFQKKRELVPKMPEKRESAPQMPARKKR